MHAIDEMFLNNRRFSCTLILTLSKINKITQLRESEIDETKYPHIRFLYIVNVPNNTLYEYI